MSFGLGVFAAIVAMGVSYHVHCLGGKHVGVVPMVVYTRADKWLHLTTGKPITAHGFRATFKTWAEEVATFPHAVVETALGHTVGNAVERADRRTDLLEQPRGLMDAWARHCEPREAGDAKIIELRKA